MKKYRSMIVLFLVTALAMAGSIICVSAKDVDSTQPHARPECETEIADPVLTNEEEDGVMPVYEPCSCGGRVITSKISESGYIKGIFSFCEHGLNGNVWTNTIMYTSICQSCGEGATFTQKVEEVRCNH